MREWSEVSALAGVLRGYDKVYIQTHDFPDPDAVGAASGLQELLGRHGIDALLVYNGKVDKLGVRKMVELLGIEMHDYNEIRHGMKEEEAVVLVDCQKAGGNVLDIIGDEVACIDHHPVCSDMDQYDWQYHRVTGSCCTLVAELFADDGEEPSPKAAAGLLFGLKSDTADFSRGVTEKDVIAYRQLFTASDKDAMAELEKNAMEFSDLRAYGEAIRKVAVYGRVGFAGIGFPCPDALVALVSDFLLDIEEIDVAIVWTWREGGAKFSIRSEDLKVDAGMLARRALTGIGNGGGHAGMAGGFLPVKEGSVKALENTIRERFLEVVEDMMEKGGNEA